MFRKLQAETRKASALKDALEEERTAQQLTSQREKVAIADLQAMIDLERSKMNDLQRSLERERGKVKDIGAKLESEKMSHKNELEREQRHIKQLKTSLEMMEVNPYDVIISKNRFLGKFLRLLYKDIS